MKFDSPAGETIVESKGEPVRYPDFLRMCERFLTNSPRLKIDEGERYVFLSDFHMGNGTSRDDLKRNKDLIESMLEDWYLKKGYFLILNGDAEDLSKFHYSAIERAWKDLCGLFKRFYDAGKLVKIFGNHDEKLFFEKSYPFAMQESLVMEYGDNRILVFHGHQATDRYVRFGFISHFLIRFLAKPLHIKNTSVSKDSRRRFSTEKSIYRAALTLGIIAITGHTHRPLFESLSKYDRIRYTVEDLLKEYAEAKESRRKTIESEIGVLRGEMASLSSADKRQRKTQSLYGDNPFLVPCMFNSGCATGKHGITALEIEDGVISLTYWAKTKEAGAYLAHEGGSPTAVAEGCYRYVLQKDSLEKIFTRIRLLGPESDLE